MTVGANYVRLNDRASGGWLALAAVTAGLLMAGCGGGSGSRTVSSGAVRLRAARVVRPPGAPGAGIRFVSPVAGSAVSGSFTVRVAVSGFTLVGVAPDAKARQGFGHLHFVLDHGRFDQPRYAGAAGRLALRMGVNGFYSPSHDPTITYRDIPAGPHTLRVQLVNTDESPTEVGAVVHFEVR